MTKAEDLNGDVDDSEGSEFGSGIVVCLAKFSEHLDGRWYHRVHNTIRWMKMSDHEKERDLAEAKQFPFGDAARRVMESKSFMNDTPEQKISSEIEMWMNGASDHFYELDRDKAPPSLVALADLTLTIGHGFRGGPWTEETMNEIRRLWKQSCLEVDELLGVKPDWGQW